MVRKPLVTRRSKDIATERGEDRSGTQLYHHAKIHADRRHCRRDICPRTKMQTIYPHYTVKNVSVDLRKSSGSRLAGTCSVK